MNVHKVWFAYACLLVGLGVEAAEDLSIKDGLWSIHTVNEVNRNGVTSSTEATMQRCQKNATQQQVLNAPDVKDCKVVKSSSSANTRAWEGSCKVNGTQMTVKTTATKKSEDEVHGAVESTMNPPTGGISAMKLTADMKFIGPCPSDMQSGDVRTPDGKVIHPPQR